MRIRTLGFLLIFALYAPILTAQVDEEDEDEVDMTMGGERKKEKYVVLDPEGKRGFMFGANIGYFFPNQDNASFYDGTPKGDGFLDLAEFIENPRIRQELQNSIGNNQGDFEFAGYADGMRYQRPILFGGNVRYQFNWYHSLVGDVNLVRLRSQGLWSIKFEPQGGVSQPVFQNFEMNGQEDRLMASLGYQYNLSEPGVGGWVIEAGPQFTSVRITSNQFSVGTREYNILRAQSIGQNNQILNNRIPTLSFIGAYAQFGGNLEFDKFTIELAWRTSWENVRLDPTIEDKYRMHHAPFMRLVYRVSVKGF